MIKLYLTICVSLFCTYTFSQKTLDSVTHGMIKMLAHTPGVQESHLHLTPVKTGQPFTLKVQMNYKSAGLRSIFKTLGVGALTYQLNNAQSKTGKALSTKKLFPALTIGLAAGIKDIFHSTPKQYLHYSFYNNHYELIQTGKKQLRGKRHSIKGWAPTDGYVKGWTSGPDGEQLALRVNIAVDSVSVNDTTSHYKGSMAGDYNLQSMGECLPEHEVTPCNPESDSYDFCECNPGACPEEDDPCYLNPFSCACDPQFCGDDDPCLTDPFNCDCDPSYCDPDPDPDPEPGPDPEPIKNNVTDPCIKNPINSILALPSTIAISGLLSGTFNGPGLFNLSFNQVMFHPNPVSDAPAYTDHPNSQVNGDSLIKIDLIRPKLDIASQEYVSNTILHEIIHAYLFTQALCPRTGDAQHEYMIQNFTTTIADALQGLYSGMARETALALALGGYGTIEATNPTLWNSVLLSHGLTAQQVASINSQHRNGLPGTTPCQ